MRRVVLLVLVAVLVGCHEHGERHDHSTAHPDGHDHHETGHGHDEATVAITKWSERFELFAEHEAAVVGEPFELLAHLTVLDDFSPLTDGTVTLELSGPAEISGRADAPIRPGIYRVGATAPTPGTYRGRLRIDGSRSGAIDDLEVVVSATEPPSSEDEGDHGVIEFLKEQQWGVPFGTAFPEHGALVATVRVPGRISTPPGGQAVVAAPVTGRIAAPRDGFPRPGQSVKAGATLATFVPAPSAPEDVARVNLALAEANGRAAAATAALQRAERLYRDEAIAKRELEDAQRESKIAEEAVRAAQQAAELFAGASGNAHAGSWRLTAPIDGIIASVHAKRGATAQSGETLFEIVDTRELWIVARIAEQDAARLRTDADAAFRVTGLDTWFPLDVSGDSPTASIITVAPTVDPTTRTVDVIYAVARKSSAMRVGGLVEVDLPTGEDFAGVVIPRSALLDREGRSIVYVQVDGEHFEERLVRVGPRSGDRVGVTSGLATTERIVTRGAHLVRLAESAAQKPAHGHIH